MSKQYVLVKFEGNWADEMDVEGFIACTKDSWKKYISAFDKHDFPKSMCIGTNEDIEWESKKEFLQAFKVKDITEEDFKALVKLFKPYWAECDEDDVDEEEKYVQYGFFPDW